MPVVDPPQQKRQMVEQLRRSQLYRDYEQAFRATTGLPLSLRAVETFDLPHRGDPNESPFCALMAGTNQTCAACLRLQQKMADAAGVEAKTLKCFAGLCDSAVPVRVGENLIAFLQTGQVLLQAPAPSRKGRLARALVQFGVTTDLRKYEEAYFQTRVVSPVQYRSILRLLEIFAQHLGTLSNQLAVQEQGREMPAIGRARELIAEHHGGELTLTEVARRVNMSAFYFCKTFHKATGLTFTDYLARVRVEKVKNLLLNPNKRISEAAYEAGFQSLSQFNRVFRRVAGEPPTVFREKLHRSLRG